MKKIVLAVAGMAMFALSSASVYAGSCDVTVTWSDGKPKSGVKIGGYVSGGGMADNVRTNSNGQATLKWSSDNSVANLYIDGAERSGCSNGGSANFAEK
jgi:hypothetical protein